MSQKKMHLIYLASTIVLTIIVIMFIANSLFNHEAFRARFTKLGYPEYLIYPVSIGNMLGLAAIWCRKSEIIKGIAYAGFMFNFLLAFAAELSASDADVVSPILALVALSVSFVAERKRAMVLVS